MLPSGTVTFLFTDVEGSTRLLQEAGELFSTLLENHHHILRESFTRHGGIEVDNAGDGFFFAFASVQEAAAGAVAAQRGLAAHPWQNGFSVKVRMGIHTGVAKLSLGKYVGLDVHKAARIMSVAHGGQVLLSQSAASLLGNQPPEETSLRSLGDFLLKDLSKPESLFQMVFNDLPSEFPPVRCHFSRKNNLPFRATSLLGREEALEEICQQMRRTDLRLLTLVGPGGIGKTSLSIEAGRFLLDDFEDGVFLVLLAPLKDPDFVGAAIAQSLGLSLHNNITVIEQVQEGIGEKSMLLILDNFEHVVSAAPMVGKLLESCPNLKILVTSRIVLRLRWEWELPVPPLTLANPVQLPPLESLSDYPSIALFSQRAAAASPRFSLDDGNAPAVAEICCRLDGLPLAIELAAARIKILPPQAILSRLGKRMDLLRGGGCDLPERHQTLRQAIGWSYDLLQPEEQALFRRLGVFAGGFNLESAEALALETGEPAFDVLDGIASLVDQSLVRVMDSQAAEPRYLMLETILEFAQSCLRETGEEISARNAHAKWFLQMAEESEPHLTGPDSKKWLDGLERELDNLRSALQWLLQTHHAEWSFRMGTALWRFWAIRGFLPEGMQTLKSMLALPAEHVNAELRAQTLNALGTLTHELSDYKESYSILEQALELWRKTGDKKGLATTLNNLGWAAIQIGNFAQGAALSQEAFELHQEIGYIRGMAVAMNNLGFVSFCQSNFQEMDEFIRRHYSLMEQGQDKRGMAYSLLVKSWGLQERGNLGISQELINSANQILREVGDRQLQSWANTMQGWTLFLSGDYESAHHTFLSNIDEATQVHNRMIVSYDLIAFGASEWMLGRPEIGKSFLEESISFARRQGSPFLESLALYYLSYCHAFQKQWEQCRQLLVKQLSLVERLPYRVGMVNGGELLALLLEHQEEPVQAVEWLSAAHSIRETLGANLSPWRQKAHLNLLSRLRQTLGDPVFEKHWNVGANALLAEKLKQWLEGN